MNRTIVSLAACRAALLLAVVAAPALRGIVIIPTFDSSITGDPSAATIESTINNALSIYSTTFTDPITVRITFQSMASGLGQSNTAYLSSSYTQVLGALTADATSASDTIALAHLPGGTNNPVTGDTTDFSVSTANAKALGLIADGDYAGTDSTISLNLSMMNFDRVSINNAKYDLQAVVQHEVDEALGWSSGLGTAKTNLQDLFRYANSGSRSYTTAGDNAYFSIDGTTLLARFNQNQVLTGGDYGDWWSETGAQTPQVQDAFGTPGAIPDLGVELTGLDVIGYTVASIPEPAAGSLTAALLGLIVVARSRRHLLRRV